MSDNTGYRGLIAPGTVLGTATPLTEVSAGAGDKLSIATCGDGVTPIRVHLSCRVRSTQAAGGWVGMKIRDGAGGTGTQYKMPYAHNGGANWVLSIADYVRIPAYIGSKTIYAYLDNSAGTPAVEAAVNNPTEMCIVADF